MKNLSIAVVLFVPFIAFTIAHTATGITIYEINPFYYKIIYLSTIAAGVQAIRVLIVEVLLKKKLA